MDRHILNIALPAIVSNVTVPLLGLVDVAIVGHLGAPEYIGAIAIGSMIFNSVYWLFGFLRMSTSGLTAQAFGEREKARGFKSSESRSPGIPESRELLESRDFSESREISILRQALLLAFLAAAGILLLQWPLREGMLFLMNPAEEVRSLVLIYYNICVWGAPAVLGVFALNGWFVGMQDSRTPMKIAIGQNIFNICASSLFVFGLGMKVEGVALGTLLSQWGAFLAAAWAAKGKIGGEFRIIRVLRNLRDFRGFRELQNLAFFLKTSRDIFLRTLCLMSVTFFFTSAGSWQGTLTLAVNTLMIQLSLVYSYFTDGFAYAGEALAGKYLGAKDGRNLKLCIKRLFLWGGGVALLFTLLYGLAITPIVSLLTDDSEVLVAAGPYTFWAALVPFAGIVAFIWDGVFIGMTLTRGMLLTCALATAFFYVLFFLLFPVLGNHALWLAYLLFLSLRGLGQTVYFLLLSKVDSRKSIVESR